MLKIITRHRIVYSKNKSSIGAISGLKKLLNSMAAITNKTWACNSVVEASNAEVGQVITTRK